MEIYIIIKNHYIAPFQHPTHIHNFFLYNLNINESDNKFN